ncbi:MAG: C/D box methylation guide ribonucleoprotein complex aNOP56 subunit [Candidatus Thorarchaeota archaeon]
MPASTLVSSIGHHDNPRRLISNKQVGRKTTDLSDDQYGEVVSQHSRRYAVPFYLSINIFGVFVLDDESNVVFQKPFYPDAQLGASIVASATEGEATNEISSIVTDLKKEGIERVIVEDQQVARAISRAGGLEVSVDQSGVVKWFRDNQAKYLTELGVISSPAEMVEFVRSTSLHIARARISAAIEEKDLLVKNAVDAIDELDKSINILVMRLREWYSLHHPSFSTIVEEQDVYARVLASCCGKVNITRECLEQVGLSESTVERVLDSLDDIGTELSESDLRIMRTLAETVGSMYDQRDRLEGYVAEMMNAVAPTMTIIVGPVIAARLISLAGSLKELARKPSSTIQVFGAERALFRSIKTGTAPPKHGIIYRVPEINTAPYWIRGKVARALAGKLSIAARVDAYSKAEPDVGEKLRRAFVARVEEIKRQHPEPPQETKSREKQFGKPQRQQRRHPKRSRGRRSNRGGKKQ